jgi:hypothetical protein
MFELCHSYLVANLSVVVANSRMENESVAGDQTNSNESRRLAEDGLDSRSFLRCAGRRFDSWHPAMRAIWGRSQESNESSEKNESGLFQQKKYTRKSFCASHIP